MILQEGDSGHYVELLQKALGIKVDGDFGPKTKAAVMAFQAHNGLQVDGIVGPLTAAALRGVSPPPVDHNNPPPVQTGGPIYGVDIYHLDNVKSFDQMKAGGIEFCICKSGQGLSADSKFDEYFFGAKRAGLITGAYHFYSTSSSQKEQAQFFAANVKAVSLGKEDFPPVFDFENSSGDYSHTDYANCRVFVEELASLTGRLPMIYLSTGVIHEASSSELEWLKKYPWWIARYRSEDLGPGVEPWVLWQFAESASIPGLGNKGDKNKFRGSLEDLKTWISKT